MRCQWLVVWHWPGSVSPAVIASVHLSTIQFVVLTAKRTQTSVSFSWRTVAPAH